MRDTKLELETGQFSYLRNFTVEKSGSWMIYLQTEPFVNDRFILNCRRNQ